jgi:hypothetical protein
MRANQFGDFLYYLHARRSSYNKVYLSNYQPSPLEAPKVAEPISFVEVVIANIKLMSVLFHKTKYIEYL